MSAATAQGVPASCRTSSIFQADGDQSRIMPLAIEASDLFISLFGYFKYVIENDMIVYEFAVDDLHQGKLKCRRRESNADGMQPTYKGSMNSCGVGCKSKPTA